MAEPTVQVSVSLPTREQVYRAAQDAVFGLADHDAVVYPLNYRERKILDAVLALLSQPTPTAEPMTRQQRAQEVIDRNERDRQRSAPPIIADMVPGTTDPFANRPQLRHLARRHDVIETEHGTWLLDWYRPTEPYIRKVDPSTIRDVAPPSTESTK